jgi:uncharacterized repeat protein (TIGR03803 family)
VLKTTPDGVLTVLQAFSGANGLNPGAGLVQGLDGNFYGTTEYGGNMSLNAGYGLCTVFRMTPSHAFTTLVSFTGANGSYCTSGLLLGTDGNYYGMTAGGGSGGAGTVFQMTPARVLKTLVAFGTRVR